MNAALGPTGSIDDTVRALISQKAIALAQETGGAEFRASVVRQVAALRQLAGDDPETARWYGDEAGRAVDQIIDAYVMIQRRVEIVGLCIAKAVQAEKDAEGRRRVIAARHGV